SSENEFRSRKFFESQRDQITPNFQNAVYSERIPLSEYSRQRRASTDVPLSEVKKFNLEIDKVFLQTVKSDEVDDQFVQEYVQHVNKNSGSIEHLIVYESGMPKAIRVPDPQRPGQYLEHPIKGEMVSTIIKQVEEDEKESYALFNMVNFGDSLVDYMAHIESKESELTTLAAMNHRLKEMKSLEK
ncbi:MAG: hypothetical protein KC478_02645, partial [Bacteriovoracaceae bacterium]|nr:hypothetical protein [Bacteriovoracaceae bacterium]